MFPDTPGHGYDGRHQTSTPPHETDPEGRTAPPEPLRADRRVLHFVYRQISAPGEPFSQ